MDGLNRLLPFTGLPSLCMLGNISLLEARVICGLVPRFEKGDAYFLLQDDNCRSENNHDMSSP